MCASAIFVVGTSGILPKLNYRSVKSYNLNRLANQSNLKQSSYRKQRKKGMSDSGYGH